MSNVLIHIDKVRYNDVVMPYKITVGAFKSKTPIKVKSYNIDIESLPNYPVEVYKEYYDLVDRPIENLISLENIKADLFNLLLAISKEDITNKGRLGVTLWVDSCETYNILKKLLPIATKNLILETHNWKTAEKLFKVSNDAVVLTSEELVIDICSYLNFIINVDNG